MQLRLGWLSLIRPGQSWASYAAMAYNAGAIAGYISLGSSRTDLAASRSS
jgi:hypothetical protein